MYDDELPRRSARGGGGGGRGILYIVFLAAVAFGVWYFWNNGFDFKKAKKAVTGQSFSQGLDNLFKGTPEKAGAFASSSKSFLTSGFDVLVEKPKEIAIDFATEVKQGALDAARKAASQTLGIPVGTGGEQPGVSISRPLKQALTLLIGADVEDLLYAVDWGDTKKETGSVKRKEEKPLDHLWPAAADYMITVELTGATTGKKSYTFPVTIQK